ncbi:O-succinylbenzoic acid-CoA ligase [Fibrella aestuarina BUZ 2]|uniref:O-succinylbenzoic acid-CoA ligase n=1 Tax=Fibrella aestuarina BUZ 2 TaxID=1166018 RepID=I0K9P1_9BACT|nr:AMP-binding protein [Fibrella aestuarina]CCH00844.1 O-succinylbenzoic acid-CoA ligase [Fibrella aestuarina BUZ 2]
MTLNHLFIDTWRSGEQQFILKTSGSTGLPKPIHLTRSQMEASARLTGQTFGLEPGDRALVCLNTDYIAGVMMLVRGEVLGLELTLVEPSANPLGTFDPATTHFDFAAFVPLQLQTMLADVGTSGQPKALPILNGMKAILVGGAATSPALETALQAIDAPVYSTYGMTETVSHIAIRRLNGPDRSDLFTVLSGVDVGTDERGCLHITAAATNYDRIQTNDVVELLPSDSHSRVRFRLLGRADSIINTGGVKVQPEAVEAIIARQLADWHLGPRLFVVGLPDERLGQRIVVFSEGISLTEGQWQAVQQAVRQRIGPYAVPKAWQVVSTFVETATGKIDRKATIHRNEGGRERT